MQAATGLISMTDKIVLVTGVSRGIGRHVAKLFHDNGARVIGISRTAVQAPFLTDHYSLNVGDYQSVNQLFHEIKAKYECADVLVNCAGVARDAYFARLNEQNIREVINVNLEGTIYMSRSFSKLAMTHRNNSEKEFSITNIGSPVGSLIFPPGTSIYATTKAALYGLTKSLSAELLPYRIRVNMVRPGYVRTDMTKSIDFEKLNHKETSIDDVAHAILAVATNKSMNGSIIDVNAGMA